jgi:hypothetical protein
MHQLHFSLGLTLVLGFFAPAWGFAHALHVTCTLARGNVEVESFYDDDTPAIKADVLVVNAKEATLAQGTTNAKGRWSFAAPAPGAYEVRVNAGAGHRAKTTLVVPPPTTAAAAPMPPAGAETNGNDGMQRADFTRTPWVKILLGLVIIGGCSVAFLIASLWRKNQRA